jgi:hypothetical protein
LTPVGAPGTFGNVIAFDGADIAPMPTAFVAATSKVYELPFSRPVTVAEVPVNVAVLSAYVPPPRDW